MPVDTVLLVAVAVGFALVSGANDGGSLVVVSLNLPAMRPLVAAVLLAAGLAVGALVIGTHVATTLANRLVPFGGTDVPYALPIAVGAAVGVVAALSRAGLPTSLTLALIGGIAGAGLGLGLPVSWGTVAFVLGVGAVAPLVGLALGFLLVRLLAVVPSSRRAFQRIGVAHRAAFALLCLAYAVNDGQKMLAVFAVAFATAHPVVEPRPGQLAVISVLFLAGTLLGVRRLAGTLGSGVLPPRPLHLVTAELSGATAVLGSAAVGAPVSITQSLTGGLVGSGISESYGKVRWRIATQIGIAWVVTLPAAALLAGGAGAAARRLAS